MSNKPPKSVRLGFERDCMEISLDLLHVEIPLPAGIKETVKYKQVCTSVQAIGLVEPIVEQMAVGQIGQGVGAGLMLQGFGIAFNFLTLFVQRTRHAVKRQHHLPEFATRIRGAE